MNYLFLIAAAVFVLCGLLHSVVGEKLLIIPILKGPLPPFFGSVKLARRTLRMAWHVTTVAWLGFAALLVAMANPAVDLGAALPAVLVATCVAMAALSLIVTRGTHLMSWVGSLVAAGLILAGVYFK